MLSKLCATVYPKAHTFVFKLIVLYRPDNSGVNLNNKSIRIFCRR